VIALTRISGQPFVLNCDLIERIDCTPDTVVSLVDGKKYVVLESSTQVAAAIRLYRSEIIALSHHLQPEDLGLVDEDATVAHLSPVTPITREV
jgi:flagellar protein FlbD